MPIIQTVSPSSVGLSMWRTLRKKFFGGGAHLQTVESNRWGGWRSRPKSAARAQGHGPQQVVVWSALFYRKVTSTALLWPGEGKRLPRGRGNNFHCHNQALVNIALFKRWMISHGECYRLQMVTWSLLHRWRWHYIFPITNSNILFLQ